MFHLKDLRFIHLYKDNRIIMRPTKSELSYWRRYIRRRDKRLERNDNRRNKAASLSESPLPF
jgi:hypothetical protein